MQKHYLFSGGGTLGPVTPLLAVAEEIRAADPDAKLTWIGTTDGPERELVEKAGIAFFAISSGKFRRYASWKNVEDAFRVIAGFFQALELLYRLRPTAVVSAGGFVAVPVVWAALILGIRTHVHQQDVRPGLANRLSAPAATTMSAAFEKSLADFPRNAPIWTGNPVRRLILEGSKAEAQRLWDLEAGLPTVLILGGGTGAANLNALTADAAKELCKTAQVMHLTGKGKTVVVPDAPPRYHQLEFLADDLRHAYAAADLVVTRAGMGVLTELAALGKPAIIIPIPGSHQEENARLFESREAAIVADESRLTAAEFTSLVQDLCADQKRLADLSARIRDLTKSDAAHGVAAIVVDTNPASVNKT